MRYRTVSACGVPRSDGDLSELIRNPRSISVLVPRIVKWMNQRQLPEELIGTNCLEHRSDSKALARAEGEPVIAAPITRSFKSSSSEVQL
jgi:hypothetical protein